MTDAPGGPGTRDELDVVLVDRDSGGWRPRDDRPRPRWTPHVPLADRITKRGRFERIDPRRVGRAWSRAEWVGFVLAVVSVGGVLAKAWRDAGGLAEATDSVENPSDAGAV
ncbi:MAG: hypothetical protein ACRDUY_16655 [Nitriliruptorales bacterium]